MSPLIWLDEQGRPRPTRSCPRCGADGPATRHTSATLRQLGWRPYGEASWVNWCGHKQQFILMPDADGWCSEVPILGEAA